MERYELWPVYVCHLKPHLCAIFSLSISCYRRIRRMAFHKFMLSFSCQVLVQWTDGGLFFLFKRIAGKKNQHTIFGLWYVLVLALVMVRVIDRTVFHLFFYTVSIGNAHISRELNVESMHSRPVAGKPRNSKRCMSLLNIYFVLILFVSYREAIG